MVSGLVQFVPKENQEQAGSVKIETPKDESELSSKASPVLENKVEPPPDPALLLVSECFRRAMRRSNYIVRV